MAAVEWAHVLGRYSERLHAAAGDGHHVVSPLGAVVALCAPAAQEDGGREALALALGVDPDEAFTLAATLLADPHPLVATAAGLWARSRRETPTFRSWRDVLPQAVATGDLPSQAELDAWASEHTLGLIERFPIEIAPTAICVLASALATKVSWEVPFEVVGAQALGQSRWSATLRSVLRAPAGDPRHRQFLASSERAGKLCVHVAQARGGLLVGSVIAVDEDTPPGTVLAAAEEIVAAEANEPGSARRVSLFDLPLGEGPLWTISEEPADVPGMRGEQVVSTLPAWEARTTLDLAGVEDLGFADAARIVASALELGSWWHEARQACMARYSAVGVRGRRRHGTYGRGIPSRRPTRYPAERHGALRPSVRGGRRRPRCVPNTGRPGQSVTLARASGLLGVGSRPSDAE